MVVLDRDGTIVVDKHYLGDPAGLEFLPGAAEGLQQLAALGCRLVIITNQSGIGRGLITDAQVRQVNDALNVMIARLGVHIEGVYYCPHHPDAGCECRKPKPGLLLQAARELGFDPRESIVIGDKESDVQLGHAAGARAVLIGTSNADSKAEFIAVDLVAAANWIAADAARSQ